MEFILDVHLHTVLSGHAHSTALENAQCAKAKGLRFMGMADHAPGLPGGAHIYNFAQLWSMPDELAGVRLFRGAEANIMDYGGALDLPDGILGRLDFVIASMHSGVLEARGPREHSAALAAAMRSRHVHIIGHPGGKNFELDMEEVVLAAAGTGTALEVNAQSLNPRSYRYNGEGAAREMLRLCKRHGVSVLASSDAHICANVGEFGRARELILESGIGEELVLNTCGERFLAAIEKKRSAT